MSDKIWSEDMGEISGFGGGYEQCCRDMVLAGIAWMDAHPDSDPKFHGFRDVYGVILEDNEDARGLAEAVIAAAKGEATGAQHHACIGHVLAYRRLGWDRYCARLRERETSTEGEEA